MNLTHLCRIEFPTVINWNSPFLFQGMLDGVFHFYNILLTVDAASDLGLHYLPMPHKKDARVTWVKLNEYAYAIKSSHGLGHLYPAGDATCGYPFISLGCPFMIIFTSRNIKKILMKMLRTLKNDYRTSA